jgi:hypothetical protein
MGPIDYILIMFRKIQKQITDSEIQEAPTAAEVPSVGVPAAKVPAEGMIRSCDL